MVQYRLEIWDPTVNKYHTSWEGSEQYADVMFNKGYNRRHTRRLIKIETTIVKQAKRDKYS